MSCLHVFPFECVTNVSSGKGSSPRDKSLDLPELKALADDKSIGE